MIKYFLLLASVLSIYCSTYAQQTHTKKVRYYKVWITSVNSDVKQTGFLYEVNDSSVLISNSLPLISNSTSGELLQEFSYNNIDLIKVRKLKGPAKGALIGSSAGAAGGLVLGIGLYGDAIIMFAGAPAIISMFPFAVVGAGTGALIGSIKDRIPIESNYENFDIYRGPLQAYSFKQESTVDLKQFEHRGFTGFSAGLLFPFNQESGAGWGGSFIAGYRLTKNWGISISQFTGEYNYSETNSESRLSIGGITAGPFVSAPLNNKLKLDLKTGAGFSDASVFVDNTEEKSGQAFSLNLNLSLMLDISKRGGLLAEAGFLSTKINMGESNRESVGYMNLSLGYVYKFSRTTL